MYIIIDSLTGILKGEKKHLKHIDIIIKSQKKTDDITPMRGAHEPYGAAWTDLWKPQLPSKLKLRNRTLRPPDSSMAGPAQRKVQVLKVVKATKAAVRAALRAQGYRAARILQLMRDCEQYPPRNPAQRKRQTPQDLRHTGPPTWKAKQPCLQTQRNTSILSQIHDDR